MDNTQIKPENIKAGDEVSVFGSPPVVVTRSFTKDKDTGCVYVNWNGKDVLVDVWSIIAHRPAFDWKDVKWGMAFKTNQGAEVRYIGPSLQYKNAVICQYVRGGMEYSAHSKHKLTRHPEGDIKTEKE